MSKLSKKVARDYVENKKRSNVMSGSGASQTQINEQQIKEEYQDGRTVYKISKHRSLSPNHRQLRDQDDQHNH